tara:strand:+ start:1686 stop:2087 length:402 start_codon:yes stop_codon:yes gene_type:complete
MVKNQLFKSNPPEELCLEVLSAFGLSSFDDVTNFSKKDIEIMGTVAKLYELKPKLEEYYIPCKARTYLNDITPKNSITILRQILRCVNRTVSSKEKYVRASKFVVYQIIPKNFKQYQPVKIENNDSNYLIKFD